MGRRGPSAERYGRDGISFVQTKLVKSRCEYCSKCPNRLFAKDEETIVSVSYTHLTLPTT